METGLDHAPPASSDNPITGYLVAISPDAALGGPVTLSATESSYVASSLTNGTAYQFEMWTVNERGVSQSSNKSNLVTPSTVPGKPLNVTAVSGDAEATVSFEAPSDNGGSEITGYVVTAYKDDGVTQVGTPISPSPKTGTSATKILQ